MADRTDMVRREHLHRRGLQLEIFTIGWNVVEAGVAVTAGIVSGSTALIAFGADSLIEVTSAVALLWRLRKAGPHASAAEQGAAEGRALYLVASTFFLLAVYVLLESLYTLLTNEAPDRSTVGLILSGVSLVIMPVFASAKHRTGRDLGSRALQADAVETWVCAYLSLSLLLGIGMHFVFGWWWADAAGALAMIPVIVWQGWETWNEARGGEE